MGGLDVSVRQFAAFPLRLYLLSGPPHRMWPCLGDVGACARSLLLPSGAASLVLHHFVVPLRCSLGGRLPKGA